LQKHKDPIGFHILEQFVSFNVDQVNKFKKLKESLWTMSKEAYSACKIPSS